MQIKIKYILLIALFGKVNLIFSQTQHIPIGIYATHYAMANDKPLPGYTISFNHEPDSTTKWINLSNLIVKPRLKNAKKNIWGFSDGKDYYINSLLYDPEGIVRFSKIYYKGNRYSYFTAVINLALPYQQILAGLDMNTGQFFPISKNFVREIIEDDGELLAEFNKYARNKNDYAEFLIRYDKKNY